MATPGLLKIKNFSILITIFAFFQGVAGGQEAQFYPPEPGKEGQGSQTLGVYTPDSSSNSVHSLHGYTEGHEQMQVQALTDSG